MGFSLMISTDKPVEHDIDLSRSLCYGMMCYGSTDSELRQLERMFDIDLAPLGRMKHADEEPDWQPIEPLELCLRQLLGKLEESEWSVKLRIVYCPGEYFEEGEFQKEMEKLLVYLEKAVESGVKKVRFWAF